MFGPQNLRYGEFLFQPHESLCLGLSMGCVGVGKEEPLE